MLHLEAVARRCSVKKLFLEISQDSQEYTCAGVSFLNFAKFLKTPFLTERLQWLLLYTKASSNYSLHQKQVEKSNDVLVIS